MSTDDPQRTEEWNAPPEDGLEAAQARQAELRAELAETDVRRAEEEAGTAHEQVEAATREEEKLSRKERRLRARAAAAEAAAAEARRRAEEATRAATAREPSLSGAHVTSPGLGTDTDPATAASAAAGPGLPGGHEHVAAAQSALERPEVQIGLAFVGAFVAARILKRIFD